MGETIQISVISVFYNRAYCVESSVQSILNQSLDSYELILVNDGSTDDTLSEFRKFDDPRINIVSHRNLGFTNSIVKAVALAKGEFIAIHGSGDFSFNERLASQFNFLTSFPEYVVVGTRFERVDETTNKILEVSSFYGEVVFDDLISSCRLMHGSVMFRKDAYEKVGGYDVNFKTSQDWDLFLRFLSVGKAFVLNQISYRQFKRNDAVAAKPENFVAVCKNYALLVKLAKESNERDRILERINSEGINSVIPTTDQNFQFIYVRDCSLLIKRGRVLDFFEYRKLVPIREFSYINRIKLEMWYVLALFFSFARLYPSQIISVFDFLKKIR